MIAQATAARPAPGTAPAFDAGRAAIEAHDLTKTYPGGVTALDGISLRVEPGEIFALLGPNGAGKSTLVKILTTLALPDSGAALVAGHDIVRAPEAVRRRIGYVSQQAAVDPQATGAENLVLQGQLYGLGGDLLRRRVAHLLERFGLADRAGRQVHTYSGGMQRKLDVAMGLVQQPEVLFLDEPTTGLDPEARAGLWDEVHRLARQDGLAILLTTHYLDEADHLADRVAIIDRGRIVAEGSPDTLKGELHGDALQLELTQPVPFDRLEPILAPLAGTVREPSLEGQLLRARADHGATAAASLLAALEAGGFPVHAITVTRPSLDDVYLRHTGRTFDAAQEGAAR